MEESGINALTPADGWYAVYLMEDNPYYLIERVAFWAAVSDGGGSVVGYVGGQQMDSAETASNYHAYVHASELEDGSYQEALRIYGERRVERKVGTTPTRSASTPSGKNSASAGTS